MASGQASDPDVQSILQRAGVRSSNYEGPTSMMAIATQELVKRGVDTLSALIQLPPYARLEEDHRGQEKLLKLLSPIYSFQIPDLTKIEQDGDRQYAEIDRMAQREPRVRSLVKQLEEAYDTEVGAQQGEIGEMNDQEPPRLAPDVETSCGDSSSGTVGFGDGEGLPGETARAHSARRNSHRVGAGVSCRKTCGRSTCGKTSGRWC